MNANIGPWRMLVLILFGCLFLWVGMLSWTVQKKIELDNTITDAVSKLQKDMLKIKRSGALDRDREILNRVKRNMELYRSMFPPERYVNLLQEHQFRKKDKPEVIKPDRNIKNEKWSVD